MQDGSLEEVLNQLSSSLGVKGTLSLIVEKYLAAYQFSCPPLMTFINELQVIDSGSQRLWYDHAARKKLLEITDAADPENDDDDRDLGSIPKSWECHELALELDTTLSGQSDTMLLDFCKSLCSAELSLTYFASVLTPISEEHSAWGDNSALIKGIDLSGSIIGASLSNKTLINCNLDRAVINTSNCNNVTFINCHGDNIRFISPQYDGISFIDCKLGFVSSTFLTDRISTIENCHFSGFNLNGNFEGPVLTIKSSTISGIFSGVAIQETSQGDQFLECDFSGVVFEGAQQFRGVPMERVQLPPEVQYLIIPDWTSAAQQIEPSLIKIKDSENASHRHLASNLLKVFEQDRATTVANDRGSRWAGELLTQLDEHSAKEKNFYWQVYNNAGIQLKK
ncbi:hypothetical protein [Corynebacterium cystitidis]|uniref:Pentapeptide repeat-containing protein n=1 Tax=Corynebacterium cystitidis DSM 20524 TaxID=1121357 RepID=A0A1H9WLT5_9CORY|nr:hypothetical protein [Corynebacterium cystitidis]WJY83424.1 hypothetical protein CCYS_12685 [Corynebacterium cystitidis DSM 20524]SES34413.1 hypothetical protein SAMN05661109_02788 [Corynebacterium cystitidis DSM 20524]SNV61797.1 Uncharacterised protein [Corynebacterium cystitidis]